MTDFVHALVGSLADIAIEIPRSACITAESVRGSVTQPALTSVTFVIIVAIVALRKAMS